MLLLIRSSFNKDANTTLLVRSFCKKFEIRVYLKKKEKIKKIITTTTNNIISKARNANVKAMFSIYKNIIIVKRQFDIVILKIKIEKSKKILKKNNF